jgi:hypothetical protein
VATRVHYNLRFLIEEVTTEDGVNRRGYKDDPTSVVKVTLVSSTSQWPTIVQLKRFFDGSIDMIGKNE